MNTKTPEPADHHVYDFVEFYRDTFEFYSKAIRFYESLLIANVKTLEEDEDLTAILGPKVLDSYPIGKELKRAERVRKFFDQQLEKGGPEGFDYPVSVTHGFVRFVKSACYPYLEHLRQRRDVIASRPTTPKSLLEAIDQQLAHFEEKTQIGIFRDATPFPLLIAQITTNTATSSAPSEHRGSQHDFRPQPVVLDTIEIRDSEVRSRCLDLLTQFSEDGRHDRLDTVVNEATRILEDRLRFLSGAPPTCTGVDLAKHAFALPTPRLVVSDNRPEQEAAHLLYRGVFGFIRNSVHHRLVASLQPDRVLQIVGMVDYLISIAEAARREQANAAAPTD